jgi:hypothetical protein
MMQKKREMRQIGALETHSDKWYQIHQEWEKEEVRNNGI